MTEVFLLKKMSFCEPEVNPIEMMTVAEVYLDVEAFVITV